jgi:hypothetical protein
MWYPPQVVIGTHAVLQPTVEFRDLGLLVVDEEQRFGVAHKVRCISAVCSMGAHCGSLWHVSCAQPRVCIAFFLTCALFSHCRSG